MAENNTEDIKQDGLQDGEKQPERDSNGQFVAGNKANSDGKGGFGDNPEHINMEGRPPKGWSWKEVLEDMADKIAPMEVDGKTLSFREAVGNRLWLEAMNGNIQAMKELFTRMEGLPRVSVEHSGHIDTRDDQVAELLQELYAEIHKGDKDIPEDSGQILQEL
mgnify:CR=1 FL=1